MCFLFCSGDSTFSAEISCGGELVPHANFTSVINNLTPYELNRLFPLPLKNARGPTSTPKPDQVQFSYIKLHDHGLSISLVRLSINAGQKYRRMLQWEHFAIRLTFFQLPIVIKIFVLSIFGLPFYTGFKILLKKNVYYIY